MKRRLLQIIFWPGWLVLCLFVFIVDASRGEGGALENLWANLKYEGQP